MRGEIVCVTLSCPPKVRSPAASQTLHFPIIRIVVEGCPTRSPCYFVGYKSDFRYQASTKPSGFSVRDILELPEQKAERRSSPMPRASTYLTSHYLPFVTGACALTSPTPGGLPRKLSLPMQLYIIKAMRFHLEDF
ncbi:hypothetical protein CEXT_394301 [Caerostris extrusa]|uniref:Uncharacterized protein n=1 Tax=Caerostris extrusa TaxID=172846 RepID=A0AAV4XNU7_CAEEX|nr:hypothetical protein CEXT_394301 [Caerostris extrusa]